ncbi:MAG: hypothetical protein HY826_12925 [Actinobacteria bacterium]|nr:hypothetical protein [Actinomycetota bacterium]
MYRHKLDLLSLLLGAVVVSIGIIASTDRLGSLINGRPDSLVPGAALAAGAALVFTALRRAVSERTPTGASIAGEGDPHADLPPADSQSA